MNLQLIWDNLVAYSLQIGLLVGLAAFIPTALRLRLPAVKLAYWQILLAACLLLPAVRPWKRVVLTLTTYVPTQIAAPVTRQPPVAPGLSPAEIALFLLGAGMLVRLVWLASGFWRLARLRRHSRPLRPVSSWGVEADLRISDAISSPVTFGFLRPAVLLPGNFPELDLPVQEAILCHEIIHVRRHDWLFTLVEELVRSVFWFHPAIWWLLGEIGLAREQVVDRAVVELTRSRDEYLDALLAIAGAKPQLDLAPAPLFLRKRHLKQRVVSIMKEVQMSKTRSISSLAAGLGVLALAMLVCYRNLPARGGSTDGVRRPRSYRRYRRRRDASRQHPVSRCRARQARPRRSHPGSHHRCRWQCRGYAGTQRPRRTAPRRPTIGAELALRHGHFHEHAHGKGEFRVACTVGPVRRAAGPRGADGRGQPRRRRGEAARRALPDGATSTAGAGPRHAPANHGENARTADYRELPPVAAWPSLAGRKTRRPDLTSAD